MVLPCQIWNRRRAPISTSVLSFSVAQAQSLGRRPAPPAPPTARSRHGCVSAGACRPRGREITPSNGDTGPTSASARVRPRCATTGSTTRSSPPAATASTGCATTGGRTSAAAWAPSTAAPSTRRPPTCAAATASCRCTPAAPGRTAASEHSATKSGATAATATAWPSSAWTASSRPTPPTPAARSPRRCYASPASGWI